VGKEPNHTTARKPGLSINRSRFSGLTISDCVSSRNLGYLNEGLHITVLYSIYFMLQEAGVNMQMNVYPASAGYAHPRMYMVRNILLYL
jgi:hypothetical protein